MFYGQCDKCGERWELGTASTCTCVTKREWIGLTAKDLAEIPPSCYEGAIWADARLKEKNGG